MQTGRLKIVSIECHSSTSCSPQFFTCFGVESTKSEFLAVGRPRRVKNPERNFTQHWCKVPNENTLSRSKFLNFTYLIEVPGCTLQSTECHPSPLELCISGALRCSPQFFTVWGRNYRIVIFDHRTVQTGKKFWKETLRTTGANFRMKILSPGQNF